MTPATRSLQPTAAAQSSSTAVGVTTAMVARAGAVPALWLNLSLGLSAHENHTCIALLSAFSMRSFCIHEPSKRPAIWCVCREKR
jgi:hypothetical protein